MKKLIIQIPAHNEEKLLQSTLESLPTSITGIDVIEILVISDGSTDKTIEIAKNFGCRILELETNLGLAKAFQLGLNKSLELGADFIVNTDADNQYPGSEINNLVENLISNKCDVIIGDRQSHQIKEFSAIKKYLQKLGSKITTTLVEQYVPDAASGFRGYTISAAKSINITNKFTYTLESLVQLSSLGFRIKSIPINTNQNTRPSKLVSNNLNYVRRNGFVLLMSYLQFQPLKLFKIPIIASLLGSILAAVPFMANYLFSNNQTTHLELLQLSGILVILSGQFICLAIIAEAIRAIRLNSQLLLQRQFHESP